MVLGTDFSLERCESVSATRRLLSWKNARISKITDEQKKTKNQGKAC